MIAYLQGFTSVQNISFQRESDSAGNISRQNIIESRLHQRESFPNAVVSGVLFECQEKSLVKQISIPYSNFKGQNIEFRIGLINDEGHIWLHTEWKRLTLNDDSFIFDIPIFTCRYYLEIRQDIASLSNSLNNARYDCTIVKGISKDKLSEILFIPWEEILYFAKSDNNLTVGELFQDCHWTDTITLLWEICIYVQELERGANTHLGRPCFDKWHVILQFFEAYSNSLLNDSRHIIIKLLDISFFLMQPVLDLIDEKDQHPYNMNKNSFSIQNGNTALLNLICCLDIDNQVKYTNLLFQANDSVHFQQAAFSLLKPTLVVNKIECLRHYNRIEILGDLRATSFDSLSHIEHSMSGHKSDREILQVLYSLYMQQSVNAIVEEFTEASRNQSRCIFTLLLPYMIDKREMFRCFAIKVFTRLWGKFNIDQRHLIYWKLLCSPISDACKRIGFLLSASSTTRNEFAQFLLNTLLSSQDYAEKSKAARLFTFISAHMNYNSLSQFIANCLVAPSTEFFEKSSNTIFINHWTVDLSKSSVCIDFSDQEDIFSSVSGLLLLVHYLCKDNRFVASLLNTRVLGTIIKICFESMNWGIIEIRHIAEKIVHKLEKSGINARPQIFSILGMNQSKQLKKISEQENKISSLEKNVDILLNEVNSLKKSLSKLSKKLNRSTSSSTSSKDETQEPLRRRYSHSHSKSEELGRIEKKPSDSDIPKKIISWNSDSELGLEYTPETTSKRPGLFKRFKKRMKSSKSEESLK